MKVYKVVAETDQFRSLLPVNDELFNGTFLTFDGTPKVGLWKTPLETRFDNAKVAMPDILGFAAGEFVLHGRSNKIVGPLLSNDFELLPVMLPHSEQQGMLINVSTLIDCLDEARTEWMTDAASGNRLFVLEHVFRPECLPDTVLFKHVLEQFETFCTDSEHSLKSIVESYDLSGVHFELAWSAS